MYLHIAGSKMTMHLLLKQVQAVLQVLLKQAGLTGYHLDPQHLQQDTFQN